MINHSVCYTMTADKLLPYDGVPRTVIDNVATPLVVVVFLLATAGIIFAVGCLIFNFTFRETKYT